MAGTHSRSGLPVAPESGCRGGDPGRNGPGQALDPTWGETEPASGE